MSIKEKKKKKRIEEDPIHLWKYTHIRKGHLLLRSWMDAFLWDNLRRAVQGYGASHGSVERHPWCGDRIATGILYPLLSEGEESKRTPWLFLSLVPFTNTELDTRKHEGLLSSLVASLLFTAKYTASPLKLLLSRSRSWSSRSLAGVGNSFLFQSYLQLGTWRQVLTSLRCGLSLSLLTLDKLCPSPNTDICNSVGLNPCLSNWPTRLNSQESFKQ